MYCHFRSELHRLADKTPFNENHAAMYCDYIQMLSNVALLVLIKPTFSFLQIPLYQIVFPQSVNRLWWLNPNFWNLKIQSFHLICQCIPYIPEYIYLLSIYLPNLPTYPSIYLPTYLSVCLSVYLSTYLPIYLSIYPYKVRAPQLRVGLKIHQLQFFASSTQQFSKATVSVNLAILGGHIASGRPCAQWRAVPRCDRRSLRGAHADWCRCHLGMWGEGWKLLAGANGLGLAGKVFIFSGGNMVNYLGWNNLFWGAEGLLAFSNFEVVYFLDLV